MPSIPANPPDATPAANSGGGGSEGRAGGLPRTASGAIDLRAWRDAKWRKLVDENNPSPLPEKHGPIPGELPGLHFLIHNFEAVDPSYVNDPRFLHLCRDPAHNNAIKPHSIQEALIALAAERSGQIAAPVMRAPDAGLDFVDGNGTPIDVKTPKSPNQHEEWRFDAAEALASIKSQLKVQATNMLSGRPQKVVVLLDTTYLSKADYQALSRGIREQLTSAERRRVIRSSVPPHRLQYDPGVWRNDEWWQRVADTPHHRVKEPLGKIPGGHVGVHARLRHFDDVNESYRDDPRFTELARDPGHNGAIRSHSLQDAMAVFAAERAGLLRPPVRRATHIDNTFVDVLGRPVSVKTPKSPGHDETWAFDAKRATQSIIRQLNRAGQHPVTDRYQEVDVLLDTTYLSPTDHRALVNAMNNMLTREQRARVTQISIPDHRLCPEPSADVRPDVAPIMSGLHGPLTKPSRANRPTPGP